MLGSLVKLILKIIAVVVLIMVLYVIGISMQLVPESLAPQQLFKNQYAQFKDKLKKDVKAKDGTSSMSKTTLDFLDKMEDGYKQARMKKEAKAAEQPTVTEVTTVTETQTVTEQPAPQPVDTTPPQPGQAPAAAPGQT